MDDPEPPSYTNGKIQTRHWAVQFTAASCFANPQLPSWRQMNQTTSMHATYKYRQFQHRLLHISKKSFTAIIRDPGVAYRRNGVKEKAK